MSPAPPLAPGLTGLGATERVLQRPQGGLRYLVVGSGPALVLCHGFLGSAENFETWLPALAARRRLLIPDLPGFGASAPLPGRHTAAQLAREVAAVADAEGAATYDLGGLCLGASVALALHRLDPPAARSLILHTPLLHPSVVRRRFHRQVAVFTAPGVFAAIARVARSRLVSDLYKRWVVEGSGPVDARSAQVNFDNQRRASPRAAREWLRDGLAHDFRGDLARFPHRVLLLVAADDRIVDVPALVRLTARRPQTEFRVIASAGHGWIPEFITAQVAALTAFLDADASGPGG